tara:strand:- start:19229 stop:19525 length:297 start_codon:yes stop_codon:yes gene_type:complete
MDLIVTAILTLLGAIGAYFGMRSKFTQRGYDQALKRQENRADMVRKDIERKDATIDSRVKSNHVKIKATAQARLEENTGKAANGLIARAKASWDLRKK